MSQMGLAGVIEFGGGLLIAIGLFTSFAAFIASGEMAAAYFWHMRRKECSHSERRRACRPVLLPVPVHCGARHRKVGRAAMILIGADHARQVAWIGGSSE